MTLCSRKSTTRRSLSIIYAWLSVIRSFLSILILIIRRRKASNPLLRAAKGRLYKLEAHNAPADPPRHIREDEGRGHQVSARQERRRGLQIPIHLPKGAANLHVEDFL